MSEIPNGLTAGNMRKRIEDKATIRNTGSTYVGSDNSVTYNNGNGPSIPAVETTEFPAGPLNTVLCSTGSNIKYQKLDNIAFGNIATSKLNGGFIKTGWAWHEPNGSNLNFVEDSAHHGFTINFYKSGEGITPTTTTYPDRIYYNWHGDSRIFRGPISLCEGPDPSSTKAYKYYVVDLGTQIDDLYTTRYVASTDFIIDPSSDGYNGITASRPISKYRDASNALSTNSPIYYGDTISCYAYWTSQYSPKSLFLANGEVISASKVKGNHSITIGGEPVEASNVTFLNVYGGGLNMHNLINGDYSSITASRVASTKAREPLNALTLYSDIYNGDTIRITAKTGPIHRGSLLYYDDAGNNISMQIGYNGSAVVDLPITMVNLLQSIVTGASSGYDGIQLVSSAVLPHDNRMVGVCYPEHSGSNYYLHVVAKSMDAYDHRLRRIIIPESNVDISCNELIGSSERDISFSVYTGLTIGQDVFLLYDGTSSDNPVYYFDYPLIDNPYNN